jgi:hypothetical protein
MGIFSKTTKAAAEPAGDVFKKAIDQAISAAADAHVGAVAIAGYLRSQAQWVEDRAYQSPQSAANTIPRMVDGHGRPIDMAAKVEAAQRERQRKIDEASVIPPHLRQSAASGYKV